MFPEIFRDEVFRLETRRMWLRWPAQGDVLKPAGEAHRETAPHREAPFETAMIQAWRAANAEGSALHLALVAKPEQRVLGALHLVPDGAGTLALDGVLDAGERGRGTMTEAIQAAAHACFTLADPVSILASPAVDDGEGRSVLEHCGFTYAGSGMRRSRMGRGLVPCDLFRLDYATWSSLQGWALPGFGAFVVTRAAAPCDGSAMTL